VSLPLLPQVLSAGRRHTNLANAVTVTRSTLVVPAAIAMSQRSLLATATFAALFAAGDLIDGKVARARGTTSSIGKLLDSGADKLFHFGLIWGAWSGRMVPTMVLQALLGAAVLQIGGFCAYGLSGRLDQRPKTGVGPVLGVVFGTRCLWGRPEISLLDVALIVVAINGVLSYLFPIFWRSHLNRQPLVARLHQKWPKGHLARNYQQKAFSRQPGSTAIVTLANAITALRLIPGLAAVLGVTTHSLRTFVVGAAVFWVLDVLDGFVARARSEVSKFGRWLDVVFDKSFLVAVATAAVIAGFVPGWAAALTIARIAVVAIAAFWLQRQGAPLPRNFWSPVANLALAIFAAFPTNTTAAVVIATATHNALRYVLNAVSQFVKSKNTSEGFAS
jgi:phosphatidylglycerophosphate synthase